MNRHLFLLACVLFALVSTGFVSAAANATIVTDTLAVGCTEFGNCKDLYVSIDTTVPNSVSYTIPRVEPGNYTVSFMYKVELGSFSFSMPSITSLSPVEKNDGIWTQYYTNVTVSSALSDVKLRFTGVSVPVIFRLDDIQFTRSPEPTIFNNFKYETGCCPLDYCWNGTGCMHAKFYEKNVSMPPLGVNLAGDLSSPATFLTAPSGYRCINGTWKFSRVKFTPLYDRAGYCPDDDQCYNGDEAGTVEKACTESGDFIDYSIPGGKGYGNFYCYKGNWTTRTKEIALQMLNMTKSSDTYTLFCDNFNRALNPDNTMRYYRDYVGDDITNILASNLSNEFCVLDLNGKVIVGISLNKEINETSVEGGCTPCLWAVFSEGACVDGCLADRSGASAPKSFLQLMKGSNMNDYCNAAMETENRDGAYHACAGTDVYYNAKLKNVIFTKMHALPNDDRQVVPLTTTVNFIDRIIEAIKSVFRNLLNIAGLANPQTDAAYKSQLDFVARAGSFNKIYLSFSPEGPVSGEPRMIKAVRETRASILPDGVVKIKTFISAEYHNYQSDICRFFYMHNYPYLRDQISKHEEQNIQCTPVILDENNWMYSVYVEQPFFADMEDTTDIRSVQVWLGDSDSFWNDMTAAIRTQSPPPYGGSLPPVPTFDFTPSDPVIGTKVNFSFTLPAEQERNIIAMTWDFGDGEKASSHYNITTLHKYAESKTDGYDVYVWIMDSNFRIRKSDARNVVVDLAPNVGITEQPQTSAELRDGNISVRFTITGGNFNFSGVLIEWGDESSTEVGVVSGPVFTEKHTYAFPDLAYGVNMVKRNVKISGVDRDGVPFSQTKEITISHS